MRRILFMFPRDHSPLMSVCASRVLAHEGGGVNGKHANRAITSASLGGGGAACSRSGCRRELHPVRCDRAARTARRARPLKDAP